MEKFKDFAQKHVYLFVVGCVLVFCLLGNPIFYLTGGKPAQIDAFYVKRILIWLLQVAPIAVAGFLLGHISKRDFGIKGLGKGLLFGLPLLLLLFVTNGAIGLLANGRLREGVSVLTIPLFILCNIMIGVAEEVTFRGVIFNVLRGKLGNKGGGLFGVVWLSSLIFGLAHMTPLLEGAGLVPTISQMIYTAVIGVFYCALYIRSKSLLPLIIIHALADVSAFMGDIITAVERSAAVDGTAAAQPFTEMTLMEFLSVPLLMLPFAIYGLFLLRKQFKMKKEI